MYCSIMSGMYLNVVYYIRLILIYFNLNIYIDIRILL